MLPAVISVGRSLGAPPSEEEAMMPEKTNVVPAAGPQPGDAVLSVRQPWVWLILSGLKRVENRAWLTSHRGRLWLHASARLEAGVSAWRDVWVLLRRRPPEDLLPTLPDLRSLPLGAVVGSVDLVDCVPIDRAPPDLARDPFAAGPVLWVLTNPQTLAVPVPAKGRLQVWRWK
jgi:activating signal cointegrator 1